MSGNPSDLTDQPVSSYSDEHYQAASKAVEATTGKTIQFHPSPFEGVSSQSKALEDTDHHLRQGRNRTVDIYEYLTALKKANDNTNMSSSTTSSRISKNNNSKLETSKHKGVSLGNILQQKPKTVIPNTTPQYPPLGGWPPQATSYPNPNITPETINGLTHLNPDKKKLLLKVLLFLQDHPAGSHGKDDSSDPYRSAVLDVAHMLQDNGVMYSWGGGNINGPTLGQYYGNGIDDSNTVGFDCSSGTQFIVYQATGVQIPRTAQEQLAGGSPIDGFQVRAGDVLCEPSGGHAVAALGTVDDDGMVEVGEFSCSGEPFHIRSVNVNQWVARRYT